MFLLFSPQVGITVSTLYRVADMKNFDDFHKYEKRKASETTPLYCDIYFDDTKVASGYGANRQLAHVSEIFHFLSVCIHSLSLAAYPFNLPG